MGSDSGLWSRSSGEGFLGDPVCLPTVEPHGEFGLGWSPGGVDRRGEVGSPMWVRIRAMGSGSVRNAMKAGGVWQGGQISGTT